MKKDEKNPVPSPPASEPMPSPAEPENKAPSAPLDEKSALREKVAEYENDLRRLQAEFQNYQNRVAKEKVQARLDGQASVLRQFLSFQDEMESALSHIRGASAKEGSRAPPSANPDSAAELRKGVELLHLNLVGLFASAGVKEISGNGPADPHKHEVVMQVPGGKEGHIAQVLRKGYALGEHVLRVAQVSVYSGVKPDEKSEESKE